MQHRGPRSSSLNNYVAEQQTQYSRCWVGVENVFRPKLQHPTVRYIETRQSGMQSRRCEVTALFLTGSCKWARPLKNSCVFSALLRARNAACKLEEKYGNDGEDLGLDTPAEASAMSKRRRVSKAQPVDTKALWVCISVPLAKKSWKLRVLMPVQKAPAGWGLMLDHSHCFFYRNRPPNRPRPGQIGPSGRPKIGRKRI